MHSLILLYNYSNNELNLSQILGSEVFLALLALLVHRVHQAVTLEQFHTVETSLGRASARKFRRI